MELATVPLSAPPPVVFRDGLGERRQVTDPTGNEALEVLCLRNELATVPSFEFALRERVSRLAAFRHPYYARVRSVERLNDREATLAVVSERVPGVRLSDVLIQAEERELALDINSALCLIRQVVPAIATLHENARDAAHGAIGPERLILTPHARLMIVDYVLGSALEQLRFSHERYWAELRVPLPRAAGLPRVDQRADVMQLGVVALSLILGRPLRDDEYPSRLGEVVASTWAVSARGGFEPLPPGLRGWLGRALQLDSRSAFASAIDAQVELDKVIGDSDYLASPASLEAFLAKYHQGEKSGPTAIAPRSTPASPAIPLPVSMPRTPIAAQSPSSPIVAPPAAPLQPLADKVSAKPAPVEIPLKQPLTLPRAPKTAPVIAEPRLDPEPDPEPLIAATVSSPRFPLRYALIGGAIVAAAAVVAGGVIASQRRVVTTPAVVTGTLNVTTNPVGVQAFVDGQLKGNTPVRLALAPGSHVVDLKNGGETRSVPVTITAGAEVAQYIELPKAAPIYGQLQVRSQPSGAQVTVDGVAHGTAPALVADLLPGEHVVVLTSEAGSVRNSVTIESGVTASLMVPLSVPDSAPVSGWISLSAPIDVQVYEHDQLLGSSQSDRIMVASGRHDFDLVNNALGFRATRTVQVAAGKVSPIKIDVPSGMIALNALPWAEVWIDGQKVGETPIGNLPVSVGSHDIVFRNPELGEQHHTAIVTLKEPTRVSVDLRKK